MLVGSCHHSHCCLLSTMICVRAVQVEPVAGVVPVCKGRDGADRALQLLEASKTLCGSCPCF